MNKPFGWLTLLLVVLFAIQVIAREPPKWQNQNLEEFPGILDEAPPSKLEKDYMDAIFTDQDETVPHSGFDFEYDFDSNDKKSFFLSIVTIIVSEIGDKTFFIAAIMAMSHSRLLIFAAAFSALMIMSIFSAVLGHVVLTVVPKHYVTFMASLLFFAFGVKIMLEAWNMTGNEGQQELEEVTTELEEHKHSEKLNHMEEANEPSKKSSGAAELLQYLLSPTFVQTFVLTFLAEWGDRSQIATIALGASENVFWVCIGTVFGHGLCTAVAVAGGRLLATKISVRTVNLVGSVLFIIFGIIYLYQGVNEQRV
ncbi:GCR1-dependent translation factor 1 [Basidiobolus ranarum]|uniref:GDT1 family protein n=1 Tax=Basidiobolus ranarum TaxID=34480 RepID=A0ABR2WU71_9FUNG